MSEAALSDAAARRAAVDPARSVILEAPAGSGKTAVLTERFLRLLTTVEDPQQILAITFTRKAAAEMRARITRALRGEFAARDPNAGVLGTLARAALAHGVPRGWALLEHPHSLRIQTIDAFNFSLASALPVASRAGGTLTVTENPRELYRRAARAALMHAERAAALKGDAQRLFEHLDNHWMALEGLIAQLLAERAHWLPFIARAEPAALTRGIDAGLARLAAARLAALAARLPAPLIARAAALPGVGRLGREASDLPHWQALAGLLLTQSDFRRQVNAHWCGAAFRDPGAVAALTGLITELRAIAGAKEALLALRDAPEAQLSGADAALLQSLSRILKHAAAELHAEFALAQRVDYSYLASAAREALSEEGEPTELALSLSTGLRHILVDEFQDTSLSQFQLLGELTVGWEPDDRRTLFVVGDPMQSIYRFRDAEVSLFMQARAAGIGAVRLTPLSLTQNFRTVPEIVEFNNALFAAVFPPADELASGAVAYRASIPRRASAPLAQLPPLALRLFPADRSGECRALAAHIAQLRAADPHGSVAVLVTAHAHAVPVIEALDARGVPALGVDLVPLRERAVVRDLVELTRALYDLGDRRAWLSVLRAPWCGATLPALSALSQADDPQLLCAALDDPARLARCSGGERARLARVHAQLRAALARRGQQPAADFIEGVWLALGGADAATAAELEDARGVLRRARRARGAARVARAAGFSGAAGEPDEPGPRLRREPGAGDDRAPRQGARVRARVPARARARDAPGRAAAHAPDRPARSGRRERPPHGAGAGGGRLGGERSQQLPEAPLRRARCPRAAAPAVRGRHAGAAHAVAVSSTGHR